MKIKLFMILVCIGFLSCEKNETEVEENVVFETNATSTIIHSGSSFDLKVTIKSKLPSSGLILEVNAADEVSGATIFQSGALNVSTTTLNSMIQNLPRQKWVVVRVKVKSTKTTTNVVEQTFRIIYK